MGDDGRKRHEAEIVCIFISLFLFLIKLSRLIKESFLGEFFQPMASSSTDSSDYTPSPEGSPVMSYRLSWIKSQINMNRVSGRLHNSSIQSINTSIGYQATIKYVKTTKCLSVA